MNTRQSRREIVIAGATTLAAVLAGTGVAAAASGAGGPVAGTEILMNEHGILARCVLIYEEGVRRIRNAEAVPFDVFYKTSLLVDEMVHQHHEPSEEQYVFSAFERAGKLTDLVLVLRSQHSAGRGLTAQMLPLAKPDQFKYPNDQQKVAALADSFIRLYRPHTAREDTVLFPALHAIASSAQIASIGAQIESNGIKALGTDFLDNASSSVAAIERELGIYDLAQFSHPPANE